ncbi:sugar phosphate nucleotidyltransferase [Acidimicrobiia bacterium]|nr:sugar phosphate nucleotidyltransferase [Acidimicrobiia bacterium]
MIILWPIAGKGNRFKEEGYKELKPFMKLNGKSMIEHAISSLSIEGDNYIIANSLDTFQINHLNEIGEKYNLNLEVIQLNQETRGQAETTYLGLKGIKYEENDELIVTNSDQYTPWDPKKFLKLAQQNLLSGVVTTFKHQNFQLNQVSPYSHVRLNKENFAVEFAEKKAISNHSLNGIFYWKKIKYFIESTEDLLAKSLPSEMWLSLTFNYLINKEHKITIYQMKEKEFYSLGTPEDVNKNISFLT